MMVKKWLTTKTIKQDHEKRFDKEKKKQNKNQKTWIILSVFRYRLLGSIGVISYHKL